MKKKLIVLSIVPILLAGMIMTTNAQTNNSNNLSENSVKTIYQFKKTANPNDWQVVNDGVMGGLSQGQLKRDNEGVGVFSGQVSLENNGGFTSVRYRFDSITIDDTISKVVLRVKGDGKRYQFRLKENTNDRSSYISHFETTRDWQTIEIPLNSMYPSFRGMKLPMSNFKKSKISEVAFLIANKKQEDFELLIDSVVLN